MRNTRNEKRALTLHVKPYRASSETPSSGSNIEIISTLPSDTPKVRLVDVASELASCQAYHRDYGTKAQCLKHRMDVTRLRMKMVKLWKIERGDTVLEIGCGHGETSLVGSCSVQCCLQPLAHAVGANGHVDAIDFAPPTYGSPLTLGEAQAYIKKHKGPVQQRLSFHLNTYLDTFLRECKARTQRRPSQFNKAVFAHSLWYFRSRAELRDCFAQLSQALPENATLCLCEWSLVASSIEAVPHVQAALAQHALELHKDTSINNIRTLLSPASIREIAVEAGWMLKDEGFEVPPKDIKDGRYEVGIVLSRRWWNEVIKLSEKKGSYLEDHIRQYWEAVDLANDTVGYEQVRSMDIWWARFQKPAKIHASKISRPGDEDFGRIGKRIKLSGDPNS